MHEQRAGLEALATASNPASNPAFIAAEEQNLPQAAILHDPLHARRTASAGKPSFIDVVWALRPQPPGARPQSRRSFRQSLPRLLPRFEHRISTAAAEGFNSVIQVLKNAARGFRNPEHYRILCGKLDLSLDSFPRSFSEEQKNPFTGVP